MTATGGGSLDVSDGRRPADLPAGILPEVFECLPDAVTVSAAVRDDGGRAVDMRLEYMNAAARAGQPGQAAPIGGLCSALWPQMVENGSFAACMRVLDTGEPAQGAFTWTQASAYRAADYEYQAVRVGPDHLLWVLRDNGERVLRAELLAEVTTALAAATTITAVMTILTARIMPAVGAMVGAAVLSEPGSDCYTVWHLHDADQAVEAPAPFSVDAPYPMAYTARTGQALFFADPAERAHAFPEAAHFFTERFQSTAVLPMRVEERLFGAVSLHFSVHHAFAESERGFLSALVGQCAQAIDRARLLRESADKQAQIQALSDVSRVLATSLDPETTFANIAATVVPRLADGCLIHLLDEAGQPALAALAHQDPAQEQALRVLLRDYPPRLDAEGGIGAVVRTGRHELVTDVARTLDGLARSPEHRPPPPRQCSPSVTFLSPKSSLTAPHRRSTTHSASQNRARSPSLCRDASCRPACRRCLAWSSPPATTPAPGAAWSAATSTTSSQPAPAAGPLPSVMCAAKALKRPR
ncbi:hypothetical protein GCM10009730_50000 [Streptomyces albidochromogenes]|uniref:GAF domain-containing protein n=1 Tax=Streptomyces albidochromogenes TaxID=329524 RepID=UPI00110FDF7B|nr:GAF domain-containing protein [Streptomyces albidochromogenes]